MITTLDEAGFVIYTLECPVTGQIRYIGQTKRPKERLSKHIRQSKNPKIHSECWINSLTSKGLLPIMRIIDECNENDIDLLEKMYIGLFRSWGFDLTNRQEGGQSKRGMNHKTREKLRQFNLGKKQSEETKAKRSATLKITWQNPELRALKSRQTTELNKLGITGSKGRSTKKKGQPFAGDKNKLSDSLKEYYKNTINPKAFNPIDKDQLIHDYCNSDISIAELSNKYNVRRTTITALMKRNNIPLRHGRKFISETVLLDLRINNMLSIKEIASMLDCSIPQVEKFIRKYKIYSKCRLQA